MKTGLLLCFLFLQKIDADEVIQSEATTALVPHVRAKRQWGGCCGMMMSVCCAAPIMIPPPIPPPIIPIMPSCCGCCLPVCMPMCMRGGCGCGGGGFGFGGGFGGGFGMFGRKKREALLRENRAPALRLTWVK